MEIAWVMQPLVGQRHQKERIDRTTHAIGRERSHDVPTHSAGVKGAQLQASYSYIVVEEYECGPSLSPSCIMRNPNKVLSAITGL